MTKNELKLASRLLKMAAKEFSKHGCNDIPEEFWKTWILEERKDFIRSYYECNGELDDYNENHLHLGDFVLMDFLADKLRFMGDNLD
jgi:hypothetical protein